MIDNLKDLMYELESSLLHSATRSSIQELDKLLAEEFVEFGSSGRIFTKNDIIERLPIETQIKLDIIDFNIKILSPDLIQTKFVTSKNSISYQLRTSIWIKTLNNNWQMIFHQGTPTKSKTI
ncbi:MAG: hypothetical protein K0S51_2174 [Bacillales bacterium]|jgi:hypothetical protein|nr:hypothetical protein [Bacillales bacterium]